MNDRHESKTQQGTPRWFGAVHAIIKRMSIGTLDLYLPDGRCYSVGQAGTGPHGEIRILNPGFFGRVMRDGELGFAEAYMDGWWDTPDLMALMDVLLLNNAEVGRRLPGAGFLRAIERARHWLRSNTKTQARKNISYHYDLGNEFYGLWLDESMTYSSALYRTDEEPLVKAQEQKYAAICDSIGVKQGDSLLEIGCGWGGFAEYAARHRGAKVTGLTISREQHDYAKERMFKAGLNERVDIVMRDYRDERGAYDGIASIEMFEAVGEKYWPVYFDTVKSRMAPGGRACLQIITIADRWFDSYRKGVDFIQKYVFPGGMLPSPTALRAEIAKSGMTLLDSHEFGHSYSLTLREWFDGFNAQWDTIASMGFDDRFRRLWNFYLASCAAAFNAGTTDVTQVTLTNTA
ncbi:SAM-dependent methyltransferase [Oceanomicrobium pacificus]|uniref:Methyltransferase domain-containing protein n=1 Tax=Oceanomicrobium pacificus TaxID=2692916 RepID=A0A6B0TPP7_9RHOB|nr:cyclopropane-fatty-acyl-phospholipid synthase family protein [Oceanomicrobium pacificus]MXU66587.1 methyltransferase domain-containing protein [Oceanomicrobium pacificus]